MADPLKEFLVALGFKVDDKSYSVFKESVRQATANVMTLGAETVAAATEIGYMVHKVAREYEQLYYVSQRTGATVAGLKSIGYAGQQVGVSYEESQSAIEGFAQALRTNPGLHGLLRAQGIDPRNSETALLQFIQRQKKVFGEQGYFAAANQSQQLFGISEHTFRQFWVNMDKTVAKQKEYKGILNEAGFNADSAKNDFLKFSNSIDTLESRFGVLKDRVMHDFLPAAATSVKWADEMLQSFTKLNKEQGGVPGEVAAGVAAFTPMLLFKRFRGLLGKAAFGGGLLGVGAEVLSTMKTDSETGNNLRSWLRAKVGIPENEEERNAPMFPWMKNQRGTGPDAMLHDPKSLAAGALAGNLSPNAAGPNILAPTLHNETKINILPGPTAWDTAQAVFGGQGNVWADAVRLFGRQFAQ